MSQQNYLREEIKKSCFKQVYEALRTISHERCPKDFHCDRGDREDLWNLLTFEQVGPVPDCVCLANSLRLPDSVAIEVNESSGEFLFPGHPNESSKKEETVKAKAKGSFRTGPVVSPVVEAETSGEIDKEYHSEDKTSQKHQPVPPGFTLNMTKGIRSHALAVKITIQADKVLRVYDIAPVKTGAIAGAAGVGGVGTTGGLIGGGLIGGLVIGSAVPVAGTVIGLVVGLAIGVTSTVVGAGAGAGAGVIHSNIHNIKIKAVEVFKKLPQFSIDKNNNQCSCIVKVNSQYSYSYSKLSKNENKTDCNIESI